MDYVFTENGNIKVGPNKLPLIKDGDDEKEYDLEAARANANGEAAKSRTQLKEASAKLAVYKKLEEDNPEIFGDLDEVKGKIEKLADLETEQKQVDKRIAAIRDENAEMIEGLNKDHAAKVGDLERRVEEAEKEVIIAKHVTPWANSEAIKQYTLPPDPEMLYTLLQMQYKKSVAGTDYSDTDLISQDGTVNNWEGIPLIDLTGDGKPFTDSEKCIASLLKTMPGKDRFLIAGSGVNSDDSFDDGNASEYEKYFHGDNFNLTKQMELETSNMTEYDRLKKKYG